MKSLLIGLAALPLMASGASAAERLADAQLDLVVAGDNPFSGLNCPGCTLASSTSVSNNGVTTNTSSTGVNQPPPPPPPPSGGGGTGGGGTGGGTGGGGVTVIIPLNAPSIFPAGASAALQQLLGG